MEYADFARQYAEIALEKNLNHRKSKLRKASAFCELKKFNESIQILRTLESTDKDVIKVLKKVEKAKDYSMGIIR